MKTAGIGARITDPADPFTGEAHGEPPARNKFNMLRKAEEQAEKQSSKPNRLHFDLLLFCLLSLPALNSLMAAEGHLIFEARVADLALPSNSLAAGMKPDDRLTATLPGELLNPAVEISTVAKTAVRRNTPEAASASDFSAFKAGDPAWIANNFTKQEQGPMRDNFSDKMIQEKSKEIFDNYDHKMLIGKASYKDAVVLLINYHEFPERLHAEIYVKEGNQWKRTNLYASDETMDVVATALKSGKVNPQR